MNEKVKHVLSAGQTRGHECHWPGCGKSVPPAMWGCAAHWFKLPKALRDKIWATYEVGQEEGGGVSAEYFAAADDVQKWIRESVRALPAPVEKKAGPGSEER